jgi:hypothetical protein
MLSAEEIKERLRDRQLKAVSERAGVNYLVLCRFASGKSRRVSYETVKRLSDYFEETP